MNIFTVYLLVLLSWQIGKMKKPYVIFDRDGTLIEHVHYLVDPNLVKFKKDIIPSLISLQKNGFKFGIITNQSVIGRGLADYKTVDIINNKIIEYLKLYQILITFFLICPHTPNDNCDCRKPKTLLGEKAKIDFSIDIKKSYYVGDQNLDMEFGKKLGCKVVQVVGNSGFSPLADKHSASLTEVATWIIQDTIKEKSNDGTGG